MLENHQNYTNNEPVVNPEAMQAFINHQNVPPPPVQPAVAEVVDEEVPEQQAEPEPEPVIQVDNPEAQNAQVEEEEIMVEDAAEDSSEHEVQSEEGEDSLQDNTTDSEDEVEVPSQTIEAETNQDEMLDIDELFSNTYNPVFNQVCLLLILIIFHSVHLKIGFRIYWISIHSLHSLHSLHMLVNLTTHKFITPTSLTTHLKQKHLNPLANHRIFLSAREKVPLVHHIIGRCF